MHLFLHRGVSTTLFQLNFPFVFYIFQKEIDIAVKQIELGVPIGNTIYLNSSFCLFVYVVMI